MAEAVRPIPAHEPEQEISPLSEVRIGAMSPERFEGILIPQEAEALRQGMQTARGLFEGRTLWNVNSTARGGGVAEMLISLLAYARGATVNARWLVIWGDARFFAITKRIHNRLHGFDGDGGPLDAAEREHYEAVLARNADRLGQLVGEGDAVILHDPQTAGLVPALRRRGVPVIWRCHVGMDTPGKLTRDTWKFLEPYVAEADATVFSRVAFAWDVVDPRRRVIIPPSIDAFAPKNQELDDGVSRAILRAAGLRDDNSRRRKPSFTRMDGSRATVSSRAMMIEESPLGPEDEYVLQVSRWDSLKDPLGVIEGFARHIAPDHGAHLVYAGPSVEAVADDPEGREVFDRARKVWTTLPEVARSRIHLALLPMDDLEENGAIVNALQRHARVVVQKSLAEGFGLTVAEAMWKSRPVVASRIGGIQDQIEHGRSGLLLDDPRDLEAYAAAVTSLLRDPSTAQAMGDAAHERVRVGYLGAHSLLAYLDLLGRLL